MTTASFNNYSFFRINFAIDIYSFIVYFKIFKLERSLKKIAKDIIQINQNLKKTNKSITSLSKEESKQHLEITLSNTPLVTKLYNKLEKNSFFNKKELEDAINETISIYYEIEHQLRKKAFEGEVKDLTINNAPIKYSDLASTFERMK